MPLLTSIIDLDSIHPVAREVFDPKKHSAAIEALAHTIVDLDGLVTIPVVQSQGIDEYELLSGYLAYFAYRQARELSPQLPDRLSVFIASKKNTIAITRQIESLQLIQASTPNSATSSDSSLQLKNLESRVDMGFERMAGGFEQLRDQLLSAIDAKLPQSVAPLDAFNRILEPAIAHAIQQRLGFLGAKKVQKLVARLQTVKQEDETRVFRNFTEVLGALEKGQLSQGKMLEVIDRWQD
jgi:hypothetical protein